MTNSQDPNAVAKAITALTREMMPGRAGPHAGTDTIFVGGWHATPADKLELDRFGLRKNYTLILATFAGDPAEGPTGYDVFINDGVDTSVILQDGRLWKRDARSAAVLLCCCSTTPSVRW